MSQVRPKRPGATVPATVWQLMHALFIKTLRPSAAAGFAGNILFRPHLLLLDPRSKILSGDWAYTRQQHLACCVPAILRTLPKVKPRRLRIDPHRIAPVRIKSVCPPGGETQKLGSVSDRRQRKIRLAWASPGSLTGTCKLIRRNHPQLRIPILPPELVPDHGHVQGT